MIRFRGNLNGKDTAGLIINNENMVRLVNGEPISFDAADLGLADGVQIFICYMENNEFLDFVEKNQAITDKTKVIYTGKRMKR